MPHGQSSNECTNKTPHSQTHVSTPFFNSDFKIANFKSNNSHNITDIKSDLSIADIINDAIAHIQPFSSSNNPASSLSIADIRPLSTTNNAASYLSIADIQPLSNPNISGTFISITYI